MKPYGLMSFEKQMCKSCRKICYCVDLRSISVRYTGIEAKWICEFCIGFVVGAADLKDRVSRIMKTNGIENIEC